MLLSRHLPSAPRGCPQRGQIPLKGWLNCTDWRNYLRWRCSGLTTPPFSPQPCLCRGSGVFLLTSSTPTQLELSKLVAWRDAKCSCAAQEINLILYSCPVVFVQLATQHMLYLEQFRSLQSTLCGKKPTTESDLQPNPSEGTRFACAND